MLKVPSYVRDLCDKLLKLGDCYIVGGAVRDLLLGRRPVDFDILFTGRRDRLLKLFKNHYIPSGVTDETVVVIWKNREFEINLSGNDLNENLKHRDFTVNAMAYDVRKDHIIDPYGGIDDLRRGLLRATVSPDDRFKEDPIRIVRGVRLAERLGFEIEKTTYRSMRWNAYRLYDVQPYRFLKELEKILKMKRASAVFRGLEETGALYYFFPELAVCVGVTQNRYHKYDVFNHILKVVDNVPTKNVDVRFAALLHDVGKPATREWNDEKGDFTFYGHDQLSGEMADAFLKRIGMPKDRRNRIVRLIKNHMFSYHERWSDRAIRKFINRVGKENIEDLFILRRADRIGTGKKKGFEDLEELRRRIEEEIRKNNVFGEKDLAIDGYDLLGIGLHGIEIGRAKRFLLEKVLEDPSLNKKEILLEIVKREFGR